MAAANGAPTTQLSNAVHSLQSFSKVSISYALNLDDNKIKIKHECGVRGKYCIRLHLHNITQHCGGVTLLVLGILRILRG